VSNQDEQREREGGKIPTRFLDESTHPAITPNRVTLCSAPSMPRRGAPTLRAAGIDRACAQHLRGHCVMAGKMRVAHNRQKRAGSKIGAQTVEFDVQAHRRYAAHISPVS
jgi:hypothetical protein